MLAVIGGTGLNDLDKLDGFERRGTEQFRSRYADEPVDVGVFLFTPPRQRSCGASPPY